MDAVLRACGLDPGRLRAVAELTGGTFNTCYGLDLDDGSQLVLKVAPDPAAPAMSYETGLLRTEAEFHRAAYGRLPVPRVLHLGVDRTVVGADFLLLTRCPGSTWHSTRDGLAPADAARLRADLGGLVAALHQVTGPAFGYPQLGLASTWSAAFLDMAERVLADAERFAVELPTPPARIRPLLRGAADVLDAVRRPALVHFDLWEGNILLDRADGPPRIGGVIDGERAFWGDPVAELVSLALFGRIERDRDFLAGYRAGGGTLDLDVATRRRLALYRAYLYLIMLVETAPRGGRGAEHDHWIRYVGRHLASALAALSRPDPGSPR
jgi:aminoglycoside phosphotransferase (APT) family kinase protein